MVETQSLKLSDPNLRFWETPINSIYGEYTVQYLKHCQSKGGGCLPPFYSLFNTYKYICQNGSMEYYQNIRFLLRSENNTKKYKYFELNILICFRSKLIS